MEMKSVYHANKFDHKKTMAMDSMYILVEYIASIIHMVCAFHRLIVVLIMVQFTYIYKGYFTVIAIKV